jgi:hypothetical protein
MVPTSRTTCRASQLDNNRALKACRTSVSKTSSTTQASSSQPPIAGGLQIIIESTFATVRNRSKITKGPGSRAAGIAMAYKLIEAAQSRWRAVNAPHLVALVLAGAKFDNGQLVERPDESTAKEEAA